MIVLVRFAEAGRDAQRGKLPSDLEAVLRARVPDAKIARATGRLVVESATNLCPIMFGLHGIVSWSECERCTRATINDAAIARVRGHASFAVRTRSRTLARSVGSAVAAATGARVDLENPEIEIGIDLVLDEVYLWTSRQLAIASSPTGPRFLADHMLGRLARWMRLCGFDVAYARDEPDSAVLRRAHEEHRVLLTRDAALAAVGGVRIFSGDAAEQLREVMRALGLRISREQMFRRCTLCNALVEEIAKEAVRGRVPPHAFAAHERFTRCPSCHRIYWQGGHYERILSALESLHE